MNRPYNKGGSGGAGCGNRRRKGNNSRETLVERSGKDNSCGGGRNRGRRDCRGRGAGSGVSGGGCGNEASQSAMMTTLLDLYFQKSCSDIFNKEFGLLNLSNFSEAKDLYDIRKSVDFNSVAFCRSLVCVIKGHIGLSLRSISLDNNNIMKLSVFLSALVEADLHGGITALSAAGNKIEDMSFVGPLKEYPLLGELLLKGNPVTVHQEYIPNVTQRIKTLVLLDGKEVGRTLLALPNPVPSSLDHMQLQVLYFLETNVFTATAEDNWPVLCRVYTVDALFSVSRAEEPVACRVPFDVQHQSDTLNATQRKVMSEDVLFLRRSVPWRNLHNEIHSLSSVACGLPRVLKAIGVLGGGEKEYFSVSYELDGNANVVFLSCNVAVPTCVLTIHGRLRWHWSPKERGEKIFPRSTAPFVSCFFHRTMSLLLNPEGTTWSVHNDMVFLRPNRKLQTLSGEKTLPLFFANEATRVERMRRQLLPQGTPEVMKTIVEALKSDHEVGMFIGHITKTIPHDQLLQVFLSKEAVESLIMGVKAS